MGIKQLGSLDSLRRRHNRRQNPLRRELLRKIRMGNELVEGGRIFSAQGSCNVTELKVVIEQQRAISCPLRNQYYFGDIRNVDLPPWPTMIEWPGKIAAGQFFGYFMSCSHPSYKGHQQIADAILDALFQEEGTNTLPVTSLI